MEDFKEDKNQTGFEDGPIGLVVTRTDGSKFYLYCDGKKVETKELDKKKDINNIIKNKKKQ